MVILRSGSHLSQPYLTPSSRVPWRSVNTQNFCSHVGASPHRHSGLSPTGQLPPHNPPQDIPSLSAISLNLCQGRLLPRPSVLLGPNIRPHGLNLPGVHAENPLYVIETQPNTFRPTCYKHLANSSPLSRLSCRISPCTFSREQRSGYSEAEK